MDQSEKTEALTMHGRAMQGMGVPDWAIDLYVHVCGMPYKAVGDRLRVKGNVGAQLATGIDYTTVCNSLTTIMFWLLAYSKPDTDPVLVAETLGLSLKLKTSAYAGDCTFLKGWWQPGVDGGVFWYPLPSQVIKLGKVMREPRLFSRFKGKHDGVRVAAWAIAQSMPSLPENYPVLGPFLAMLRRNGKEGTAVVSASEDGWYKPQTSGVAVDRRSVMQAMTARYDLDEGDIIDCEELLNCVDGLPVFVSHKVFERFKLVDYC
jgi:hypothetical protein